VTSLATAGNLILTGSDDRSARLWDARTGALKHTLQHTHWVRGVAISPDGSMLATNALDDELVVWDAVTGKPIFRLPGHGSMGGRREVRFTPDSKRLLSYGDDRYVRVTDLATGKAVLEFPLQPSGIQLPDENQSGLDRAREEMILNLTFWCAAFTPAGDRFVLQTNQKYHLFDVAKGKEVLVFPSVGEGFSHRPPISPDGKYLVSAAPGKPIQEKSTDGRVNIRESKDHFLTRFDLATGLPVKAINVPCSGFRSVAYSPDGTRLAVVERVEGGPGRVSIRDAVSLEVRSEISLPGRPAWSIAFLSGGRLAVPMADTTVLVYGVKE
jgi:WD40 repeat protein